jgi:hypothetical protein
MQSKGQSRRCEHRQNYATAVNTEVNMPTPAPRSGTGKAEAHAKRARSGTFRLILVWNASCSYRLSSHARVANATLRAHEQRGPASAKSTDWIYVQGHPVLSSK